MKRVVGIVAVLTLFPTVAFSQDSLCFMEWHGQTIDLSYSMCRSSTSKEISAAESNQNSNSDIRLSNVRIEPTKNGKAMEIKGTLTNESNEVSSLSLVEFDVINKRDGSVVTSDTAEVEAGDGIKPGEQIAFSKLISRNTLGEDASIPDLRVEITGSV